ncbi:MAG: hypothetical protein RL226_2378 [Bacteroidota bacterium]
MNPGDLEYILTEAFPYAPTSGQEALLRAFSRFLWSTKPKCTLLLRGYAGTGKTTVTGTIVQVLKSIHQEVVLMAPTGRAAKVLSGFAQTPAYTIHKTIYLGAGEGEMSFALGFNRRRNTLFVVDEASMIGEASNSDDYRDLLDDLMAYVFAGEGCRLMLIGDGAQLPPVGTTDSPALRLKHLEEKYDLTIAEVELSEVVRQEIDSGILLNANVLRQHLTSAKSGFPQLQLSGFKDIQRVSGNDLQELLEDLYGKYGQEGVCVITRSNKRANLFNQQIRSRILWQESELTGGDMVMVVRNNYHWLTEYKDCPTPFLANGDGLEIVKVGKHYERYGLHFADATVRLADYPDFDLIEVRVLLDVILHEQANLGMEAQRRFYEAVAEDYLHLGSKRKVHEAVMNDPFYNALQIKFGYAITCHKSQGGQWPAVIVDQGYLTEEMLDESLLRWFYTAFTRSTERLYLLNFADDFFGGSEE